LGPPGRLFALTPRLIDGLKSQSGGFFSGSLPFKTPSLQTVKKCYFNDYVHMCRILLFVIGQEKAASCTEIYAMNYPGPSCHFIDFPNIDTADSCNA